MAASPRDERAPDFVIRGSTPAEVSASIKAAIDGLRQQDATTSASPLVAGIVGLAVADAVGVPAEFRSRESLDADPITDMVGYGTYHQPPGYFSDDTSLALGLAESLCHGFDLTDQARRLVNYREFGYWTPADEVFDIGNTTATAIGRLRSMLDTGDTAALARGREGASELDNGNGALMRILPLWSHLRGLPSSEWLEPIWLHSALTHGHERSAWCCWLHLRVVHHLADGATVVDAIARAQAEGREALPRTHPEAAYLDRLLHEDFAALPREHVRGSGYVVASLEAAWWALAGGSDYRDVVLRAVNLGQDTDTTACIAGGPAAIAFGLGDIPAHWLDQLARRDEILALGRRLEVATAT